MTEMNLEDLKMWINFIANGILTGALGMFLIYVFGRDDSVVHKFNPIKTIALKAGLALCSAGALYNCLSMSNPQTSEVMMNAGFASLFTWAAAFHYDRFMKPKPKAKSRLRTKTK